MVGVVSKVVSRSFALVCVVLDLVPSVDTMWLGLIVPGVEVLYQCELVSESATLLSVCHCLHFESRLRCGLWGGNHRSIV
jgi:hypothetical protein